MFHIYKYIYIQNEPIVITDEQKKELYEAIDYDEEKATIAAAVDMPKDVSCPLYHIIFISARKK